VEEEDCTVSTKSKSRSTTPQRCRSSLEKKCAKSGHESRELKRKEFVSDRRTEKESRKLDLRLDILEKM